ncbi:hypothetical protein HX802_04495 [Marine Group I thaumarchaeote]|uniref:Biofilm-associated protein n=1 Tax=Marine Group I thaumarchaeote TaxID=2511932 RepID=A0A7K4NFG8_9ARCH|nr:hypothetical protein [Marine Group I thaumarchaeote]
MRRYSTSGIFTSVLLVFSIFTLLSISEVNAEEVISVNAVSYENAIIIEFENESASKIKTIRMWISGEKSFKSFKTELGWSGGKYSDGKLLIFTVTDTLNPGESVKFGLTTNQKVFAINWKALDQNEQSIDTRKTHIQEIDSTTSSFAEEESKAIEEVKETGGALYGSKKFIPEKIRVGSDIRLAGYGFGSEKNLKLYLDDIMVKSVETDKQGNFLTTISIPETYKVGTSEFIIKSESGNFQSTNINIEESENRFLKTAKFEVNNIPAEVGLDELLTISGNAYPQSAIILAFENNDRVLEKVRVITASASGEWIFEERIDQNDNIGEKYVIFKNNKDKTTKNLTIKSGDLIEISSSAVRYNLGETVSITGTSEPNKSTTIWIKDQDKKIVLFDITTSDASGNLNYEFVTDDTFSTGTYTAVVKQEDGLDAAFFGIGQYPSTNINVLMEKTNFILDSKAVLSIIGPVSSTISITVLDTNDNVQLTDSVTTSSSGKIKYIMDLDSLSAGVYRAAVSTTNIQDSVKFSIGLEPGSGAISLTTTKDNFSPGESILLIGNTGNNARLTITLFDPSGNISSQTEIFSDSTGAFSTDNIGIPANGILGNWKITAHSRLDSKSVDINVSVPTTKGITLQIEETVFSIGDTIIIKGIAISDVSRLEIKIINQSDQVVVELGTPITSNGAFSLPWTIPSGFDTGTYTITVTDNENTNSFEIFVQ